MDDKWFTLGAIYAPNSDQLAFLKTTLERLADFQTGGLLLGGDLNMVANPYIDRSHARRDTLRLHDRSMYQSKLYNLLDKYGLVDVWHTLYPTARQYTFYSSTHQSHSRIDFLLCSKTLFNTCTLADVGPKLHSDHAPVTCFFSLYSDEERSPSWSLNRALIRDDLYSPKIEEEIKMFFKCNSDCVVSTLIVWDAFKATLRGQLISMAAACKKKKEK